MTPRQSQFKRVLDDLVLRLTIWWVTVGWRPGFRITKLERLKRSNERAVNRLKQELNKAD